MIKIVIIFLTGFFFGYEILPLFTPTNFKVFTTTEYIDKRINELFDTVPEECLPLDLNFGGK